MTEPIDRVMETLSGGNPEVATSESILRRLLGKMPSPIGEIAQRVIAPTNEEVVRGFQASGELGKSIAKGFFDIFALPIRTFWPDADVRERAHQELGRRQLELYAHPEVGLWMAFPPGAPITGGVSALAREIGTGRRLAAALAENASQPIRGVNRQVLQATRPYLRQRQGHFFPLGTVRTKDPKSTPFLQRTEVLYESPVAKPGLRERITDVRLKLEDLAIGSGARIRDDTRKVRQQWMRDHPGQDFPLELNAELHMDLMPGMPFGAADRVQTTLSNVSKALGNSVSRDYVDRFLTLRHLQDVQKLHPQRVLPMGMKDVREVRVALMEMRTELGRENMRRVEIAAGHVRDTYSDYMMRKVAEGIVEDDVATMLANHYPWYNPISYVEQEIGPLLAGGGRRVGQANNTLRRLSELGQEAARERPLDVLPRFAAQAEMAIARNHMARSIIRMELQNPDMAGSITKIQGLRPVAQVPIQIEVLEARMAILNRRIAQAKEDGISFVQLSRQRNRLLADIIKFSPGDKSLIFRPVSGQPPGTLAYMQDGKRALYEIPAKLQQAIESIEATTGVGERAITNVLRTMQAPFRTILTSANPAFFASNFVIDSMTVAVTRGIMPWRSAASLMRNMAALVRHDPVMQAFYREGAAIGGFSTRDPKEILRTMGKGDMAIHNLDSWRKVFGNPIKTLETIGGAFELAPRRAVFEQALRQGRPVKEAALAGRRATVDFQRMGTAMRLGNAAYLYLNAAVQGTLLPFRTLRDSSVARIGVAGYVGLSLLTYMWNRQFAEFADVPLQDKYQKWFVMLPSNETDSRGKPVPRRLNIVPNLREFSFFTAPLMYALARMDEKEPAAVTEFLESMYGLNPFARFTGTGGLPIPTHIGEMIAEAGLNRDMFRGRDIVPPELQGLPKAQQFDDRTSETAKRLGKLFHLSPMHLQHIMGSGLGNDIMIGLDYIINWFDPERDDEVEAMAHSLKEIHDTTRPEDLVLARRTFLNGVPRDKQRAVIVRSRQIDETFVPVLSSIERRFYRNYGGQLWRSGVREASKKLQVSEQQTLQTMKLFREASGEMFEAQKVSDRDLGNKVMNRLEWRDARKTRGIAWRGVVLAASIMTPQAAQAKKGADFNEFLTLVNTIGDHFPDRRFRGELLYAAWLSLDPVEISPGLDDWEEFYRQRDDFQANLSPGDLKLFREQRKARMTPTEWQYAMALETAKPYFQIEDLYLQRNPRAAMKKQQQADARRLDDFFMLDSLKDDEDLLEMRREVRSLKLDYLEWHPTVDAILRAWEITSTIHSDDAERLYRTYALGIGEPIVAPPEPTPEPPPAQPTVG